MQTCPICKKTVKEQKHWVHCPRIEKPVCMSHCFRDCSYRGEDHCMYKGRKARDENKKKKPRSVSSTTRN